MVGFGVAIEKQIWNLNYFFKNNQMLKKKKKKKS